MCAQRSLRSAWASAQSQSLRCPHEETLGPWLPTERTAKILIRRCGCPGLSESSLVEQVILLMLSCCGLYFSSASSHSFWRHMKNWDPFVWLDMLIWRISSRRALRSLFSWDGLFIFLPVEVIVLSTLDHNAWPAYTFLLIEALKYSWRCPGYSSSITVNGNKRKCTRVPPVFVKRSMVSLASYVTIV